MDSPLIGAPGTRLRLARWLLPPAPRPCRRRHCGLLLLTLLLLLLLLLLLVPALDVLLHLALR